MTYFSRVVGLIDKVIDGECAKIKRKKKRERMDTAMRKKKKDKN